MKKSGLVGIIILICVFSMGVQAAEISKNSLAEDIEVINEDFYAYPYADDMNIRSGPSVSYPVTGEVLLNEEIHVIGQSVETGWYLVEVGGAEGFVCNTLMQESDMNFIVVANAGSEENDNLSSTQNNWLIEPLVNVPQERLDAFNERLSLAPQYLLDAFVNNGWHIYLSEYDVGSTYAGNMFGKCQGVTITDQKVIYLDNRDVVIDSVLHEFGHFVDWYLGWPSLSAEFVPLFANGGSFISYFDYSNGAYQEQELFAEAFEMYIVRGDELKRASPDLYSFIGAIC